MGESELSLALPDEAALTALAGRVAVAWRHGCAGLALSVGLRGVLGAGKTAWVRAMLRGLGYSGRVPSPTYTLMEVYEIDDISLIHIDFYRISDDRELEQLGLRDWLGRPGCWLLAEWPQRLPGWLAGCDVVVELRIDAAQARRLVWTAQTEPGRVCVAGVREAMAQ